MAAVSSLPPPWAAIKAVSSAPVFAVTEASVGTGVGKLAFPVIDCTMNLAFSIFFGTDWPASLSTTVLFVFIVLCLVPGRSFQALAFCLYSSPGGFIICFMGYSLF